MDVFLLIIIITDGGIIDSLLYFSRQI